MFDYIYRLANASWQWLIFIYSTVRILFSSYQAGSLSKSYRIGNRLLRANYSDLDGIAFAEETLFSHDEGAETYQNQPESVNFFGLFPTSLDDLKIINNSNQLYGSIFYQLAKVEPQVTPHSCAYASRFMVMQYGKNYFEHNPLPSPPKWLQQYLDSCPSSSGYDSGIGYPPISKMFATVGLFTDSKPQPDHLSRTVYPNSWPTNLTELGQFLGYLLFLKGPICLDVKNAHEPYSHYIALTGIAWDAQLQTTKVIYADPWEGYMFAEDIDTFAPQLWCAAESAYNGRIFYESYPPTVEASFYKRLARDFAIPAILQKVTFS